MVELNSDEINRRSICGRGTNLTKLLWWCDLHHDEIPFRDNSDKGNAIRVTPIKAISSQSPTSFTINSSYGEFWLEQTLFTINSDYGKPQSR